MPAKQNVAFFWDWSADKQVSSMLDNIEDNFREHFIAPNVNNQFTRI